MNKNFPGKTAVYVSSPYGKEHSCKKSEKSLARLSGKSVHRLTLKKAIFEHVFMNN